MSREKVTKLCTHPKVVAAIKRYNSEHDGGRQIKLDAPSSNAPRVLNNCLATVEEVCDVPGTPGDAIRMLGARIKKAEEHLEGTKKGG